jgi:hypothetical protein
VDRFLISIFQLNTSLVFKEPSLMHFPLVPGKSFVQSSGIFFGGDLFFRDIFISLLWLDHIEILVIDIKVFVPVVISFIDLLPITLFFLLLCLLLVKFRDLLLRRIWHLKFLA